MTQEEELLFKDLCARLPYGVLVKISHRVVDGQTGKVIKEECHDEKLSLWNRDLLHKAILNIKPYLRPLSSMTEEEEIYYNTIYVTLKFYEKEDWLNAHHFDYRGLISRGLALETLEGMYY